MDTDALIFENLGLVHTIVAEVIARVPAHIRRDDLISAGTLGLVLAARSFDQAHGVPFGRWAALKIRGAVTDELRSMDWASRSVRGRAREVETARNQLAVTLERSPRAHEVAAVLGISVSELGSIDTDVHQAVVLSLQRFTSDIADAIAPDPYPGPEQLVLDREHAKHLRDAIEELPERLRIAVLGHFFEQRRLVDIGADLRVTPSRVSQLLVDALKLLRVGMCLLEPDSHPAPAMPRRRGVQQRYHTAVETRRSA